MLDFSKRRSYLAIRKVEMENLSTKKFVGRFFLIKELISINIPSLQWTYPIFRYNIGSDY
ncbi:MAG: hypothetical protein K0S04_477 [Herbinix sp.]|jgi:hypothetical protein|nr:hypothetical protein [Herbinix sp.]